MEEEQVEQPDHLTHLKELVGGDRMQDLDRRVLEIGHNAFVTGPTRHLILDLWDIVRDLHWVNELLWEERDDASRRLRADQESQG